MDTIDLTPADRRELRSIGSAIQHRERLIERYVEEIADLQRRAEAIVHARTPEQGA